MSSSRKVPLPRVSEVIRYAYLWTHEHAEGREEASKDRPCAVVLTVSGEVDGDDVVVVVPITSVAPDNPGDAIEIPEATRRRLGLQGERCWIKVTELNQFNWPGPDLRPVDPKPADRAFYSYGLLPAKLYALVKAAILERRQQGEKTSTVNRTE